MEDFSRGTERRCANQLVTELADPAKSNPLNFSISHPPFLRGDRREGEETATVNEVYRPLMRIGVNSLSVDLRRIISRLVITRSRYEKLERKIYFNLKYHGWRREGERGVGKTALSSRRFVIHGREIDR